MSDDIHDVYAGNSDDAGEFAKSAGQSPGEEHGNQAGKESDYRKRVAARRALEARREEKELRERIDDIFNE